MQGTGYSCLGKKEKTQCEDVELSSNTESACKSSTQFVLPPQAPVGTCGPQLVAMLSNAAEPLGVGASLVKVAHSGLRSRPTSCLSPTSQSLMVPNQLPHPHSLAAIPSPAIMDCLPLNYNQNSSFLS